MDIVPDMSKLLPDKSPTPIWEAVGEALSFWEAAEINLAGLYLIFKGQPRTVPNLIAYGEGKVCSARIGQLKKAAEDYFIKHPNQAHEGAFLDLYHEALALSRYRNRIAHGIALPQSHSGEWWLMPPWYQQAIDGPPETMYFYCSGQIRGIGSHFSALQAKANGVTDLLVPA